MNEVIVLLGSNIDSLENIGKAKAFLVEIFGNVLFSNNIESEAVGNASGIYTNAVALINTAYNEKQIVERLKLIEQKSGRVKNINSADNVTIDLDLVQFNGSILRPEDAARHYYISCLKDLGL